MEQTDKKGQDRTPEASPGRRRGKRPLPPNFDWSKVEKCLDALGWTNTKLAEQIARRKTLEQDNVQKQINRIKKYWRASRPWHKHVVDVLWKALSDLDPIALQRSGIEGIPTDFRIRGTVAEAVSGSAVEDDLGEHPIPVFDRVDAIRRLEHCVRSAPKASILYVSIEHALGLLTFLQSLHDPRHFKIAEVVVRQIPENLRQVLSEFRALPSSYQRAQDDNVEQCRAILDRINGGVSLTLDPWPALPPFHGFLYDDCLLWGHWRVDEDGHLTVNHTRMWEARRVGPFSSIFDRLSRLMLARGPKGTTSPGGKAEKPSSRTRRRKKR